MPDSHTSVQQMRLVVTVENFDEALAFYRDALGMTEEAAFSTGDRRVAILDAGRATLEIADAGHADYIDEVEVGHRVAGKFRVAFEVSDAAAVTDDLIAAGATLIAPPTRTPWNSLNSRLDSPGGVQMTLFEALSPETMA